MSFQEIGPFEDLRALVFKGCEVARGRGLRLIKGRWGVRPQVGLVDNETPPSEGNHWILMAKNSGPCLCPLSTLLLGTEVCSGDAEIDVAALLDVDIAWVGAFTNGVDDGPLVLRFGDGEAGKDQDVDNLKRAAYELGREVRERFVLLTYEESLR